MDLQDFAEFKALQVADRTYVIVAERKDGRIILVADPGLGKPWSSRNKKLADDHARALEQDPLCRKASAMTINDAFPILQKQLRKDAGLN